MTGGLADNLVARIVEQRDLLRSMNDHCNSISARVTSRDQSVSVEVDGLGTMTGLTLGDNAYRHGTEGLAKLIVDTAGAAAKVAMDRRNFLVKEFNARMTKLEQTPLKKWDGTVFEPTESPRD